MDRQLQPLESLAAIEEMEEDEQNEVYALYEQAVSTQLRMDEDNSTMHGLRIKLEEKGVPYQNTTTALKVKEYLEQKLQTAKQLKRSLVKRIAMVAVPSTLAIFTVTGIGTYVLSRPASEVKPQVTEVKAQITGISDFDYNQKKDIDKRLYKGFNADCAEGVTIEEFMNKVYKMTGTNLKDRWDIKEESYNQKVEFKCDENSSSEITYETSGTKEPIRIDMSYKTAHKLIEKMPKSQCDVF